ncbi:MAG: hypothetical protein PHP50_14900 [Lachnospiraceae bacterium]|nr:hypothetical protein [Lachnospiraceae bacterium]
MSGAKADTEKVAFRPEIVKIGKNAEDLSSMNDAYIFKGKVITNLPHGNIIRCAIDCNGVQVNADMLFVDNSIYADGSECYLGIKKSDCIML